MFVLKDKRSPPLDVSSPPLPILSTNILYRFKDLVENKIKKYRKSKTKESILNSKILPMEVRSSKPTFKERLSLNRSELSSALASKRETPLHQGDADRRQPNLSPIIEVIEATPYLVMRISRQILEIPKNRCRLHLPKRTKLAN